MTEPRIRRWLTPAGFAAAVPRLSAYPLPTVSHALARLRTTAVAALHAPDTGGDAVYLVAPSHALLVDITGTAIVEITTEAGDDTGRHVHLPPPLAGSANACIPVPVVDVDTLLAALAEPGCAHLWPIGDTPYPDGWAHRAVTALVQAAGSAAQAMAADGEQDLTVILPALGGVLDDLSAIADGLTPYCGDYADQAEARLATITALLHDSATMARRVHTDVAERLHLDPRSPDLRLTDVILRPERAGDDWVWHGIGHLTDQRGGVGGCHATLITSHPHPSMAAAIDAVRDVARRWGASRPDPAAAVLLRLSARAEPPSPRWQDQLAQQAARLRMRLPAPSTPDNAAAPGDDEAGTEAGTADRQPGD